MTAHGSSSPGRDVAVSLDGRSLRLADLARVARGAPALPDAASLGCVLTGMRLGDEVALSQPVYGRTTGVGANRDRATADGDEHGVSLLRSHAAGGGEVIPGSLLRTALAIRANQLLIGRSGVSPETVVALTDLLVGDDGDLPVVHRHGALGTGDLTALAEVGLALIGERPRRDGTRHAVLRLRPADALPLMSSNAVSLAEAALGGEELRRLARAALTVSALSWVALGGGAEALGVVVADVTPFPGAVRVAASTIELLGVDTPVPQRIQDFFGLRTWPQAHGALLDTLDSLCATIESLVNAPSANPLFRAGTAHADATVEHHGGFHLTYLTLGVDTTMLALTRSAHAVQSRIGHLLTRPGFGVARFLADNRAGSSGLLIGEYLGASSLALIRSAAASPTSVQSASVSDGVEDDASFANLAAAHLPAAADAYRRMLAVELVCAVRTLRMRDVSMDGPLAAVMTACDRLPRELADRDLAPDLEMAERLLDDLADLAPRDHTASGKPKPRHGPA